MKQFTSLCFAFFLLILGINARGQDSGIVFKSYRSWDEIKAEAKATNKMIFVDCYATWCGPCKMMDKEIYSSGEVGSYFNAHFISVKLQMDHTSKDSQQTKDFYSVTDSIATQHKVNAYPTFLFFSFEGIAIHKFVGASETGQDFINKAAVAFDPNKQYFTLFSHRKDHLSDSSFVYNSIVAAKDAGDDIHARSLANDYPGLLLQPITKKTIALINPYILSETDKGFAWYVNNASKIDQIIDEKGFAEKTLAAAIFNDEIAPLFKTKGTSICWKNILANIEAKYPELNTNLLGPQLESHFRTAVGKEMGSDIAGKEVTTSKWESLTRKWAARFPKYDFGQQSLVIKMRCYYNRKFWEESARAGILLIDRYGDQIETRIVNNIIWDPIFLHASDSTTLSKALLHMKIIVQLQPDVPEYLDTYANLLYKTGHRKDAIDCESRAINVAQKNNSDLGDMRTSLEKMQVGSPTWESSGLN